MKIQQVSLILPRYNQEWEQRTSNILKLNEAEDQEENI